MKAAQILKQKINSGAPTLGVLATFHLWPGLIEIAIRAGADYLIIDLEHLTHSHEKVAEMCATGRMLDFPILIRPPQADFIQVRLAGDLGPCGMLIPYVESVADLTTVQDAIYLKPRGKRRPGGPGNRWTTDINYAGFKTQVEDDFIILPQIESKVGMANVEAIARHPLTTAMAIGPYDLSADYGLCWQPDAPELIEAWKKVRAAATAAGKKMWVIGDSVELLKQGYNFICVGEPMAMVEGLLKKTVSTARNLKSQG
jgi:4-hydroxy-2-oxoheptanedioate aldolase